VSALLLGICAFPQLRRPFARLWDRHFLAALVGAGIVAYVAGTAYVAGAGAGLFGDEAREKFEAQRLDSFDPVLGLLAGGRPESFSSWAAIGDSPIIGYGSWARSTKYFNIFLDAIRTYGSAEAIQEIDKTEVFGEPPIPNHSHLFGAWVEAGIVGAIFWLVMLRHILRRLRAALEPVDATDVLVLLTGSLMIWNIFFSFFGAEMRLLWAGSIVLVLHGRLLAREAAPAATRGAPGLGDHGKDLPGAARR
jgi:O-antigen ligase